MSFYDIEIDMLGELDLLGADDIGCMLGCWLGGSTEDAIAAGNRDENALTDLEFFSRHPERNGKKIAVGEKDAAREWLQIRNDVVRPALRAAPPPVVLPRAPAGEGGGAPAPTALTFASPGSGRGASAQTTPVPPGVAAMEDSTRTYVAGGLGLLAIFGLVLALMKSANKAAA